MRVTHMDNIMYIHRLNLKDACDRLPVCGIVHVCLIVSQTLTGRSIFLTRAVLALLA